MLTLHSKENRTDRQLSYAPAGGSQPKSSGRNSKFTNCIITVVWSDGVNRTPPVLFTFNGKFRLDRVGRKAWVQEREKLQGALLRYGIDAKRVIYIGSQKNEARVYATESAELLRRFFEIYQIRTKGVIFSDNGKAFFPGGESTLEALGFKRLSKVPSTRASASVAK